MKLLGTWSSDELHVFGTVLSQSFAGLSVSGLFYGWGALAESITLRFHPDFDGQFEYQHGVFGAVIILCLGAGPMQLLQYLIVDRKLFTEYQSQLAGVFMTTAGLLLGAVSLQFRIIWLYYVGCGFLGGIGGLCLFRRIVFNHQLWFKHINQQNMGSGLLGFCIGVWTVVFFLISVPLLNALPVHVVLYIYSAFVFPMGLYPALTIVEKNTEEDKEISQFGMISVIESENARKKSISEKIVENEEKIEGISEDDDYGLLKEAHDLGIDVVYPPIDKDGNESNHLDDSAFDYTLQTREIVSIPQTWLVTIFFAALLTPGWGIKLGSYALLTNLFPVSLHQAADISAVYVTFYAFGRLFSGMLADVIGLFPTFYVIIAGMFICLIILPHTTSEINHSSSTSSGLLLFVALLWMIGLLYGGSIALFYSVVFDIYGTRNYRSVFSITIFGFAGSVIIGGLSSAYSFSVAGGASVNALASRWFYAMAGGLFLAGLLLSIVRPVNYRSLIVRKVANMKFTHESALAPPLNKSGIQLSMRV